MPPIECFICRSTHRLNNVRASPFHRLVSVMKLIGRCVLSNLCYRLTMFCALFVRSFDKCVGI